MWQVHFLGAEEVSVRWPGTEERSGLALNKCQSGLSQTVGHWPRLEGARL